MLKLTDELVNNELKGLSGWLREGDSITKNYQFNDFSEVVSAVNKIAELAEDQNHHPDILMYGWNKLRVTTSTHDANGITGRDFKLASAIDQNIILPR
ncbi:MAG: 4a-hydroxytetrahydrobiopterin dehydratase [Acidobacteriota bacterium]